MKLSASNLAWDAAEDERAYRFLRENGFLGVEIAPTRLFGQGAYRKSREAAEFGRYLTHEWGLSIASMQSIWYGRQERLFGAAEERKFLKMYTHEAIDFAATINCKNLVFGCPRNRLITGSGYSKEAAWEVALDFFYDVGRYAAERGTCVAVEANPAIYGTDFLNKTSEALQLVEEVGCAGLAVNLDLGAMVENKEGASVLRGHCHMLHHVHVSEPFLAPVERRALQREICSFLRTNKYAGFVSLEMGSTAWGSVESSLQLIKEIFGDADHGNL